MIPPYYYLPYLSHQFPYGSNANRYYPLSYQNNLFYSVSNPPPFYYSYAPTFGTTTTTTTTTSGGTTSINNYMIPPLSPYVPSLLPYGIPPIQPANSTYLNQLFSQQQSYLQSMVSNPVPSSQSSEPNKLDNIYFQSGSTSSGSKPSSSDPSASESSNNQNSSSTPFSGLEGTTSNSNTANSSNDKEHTKHASPIETEPKEQSSNPIETLKSTSEELKRTPTESCSNSILKEAEKENKTFYMNVLSLEEQTSEKRNLNDCTSSGTSSSGSDNNSENASDNNSENDIENPTTIPVSNSRNLEYNETSIHENPKSYPSTEESSMVNSTKSKSKSYSPQKHSLKLHSKKPYKVISPLPSLSDVQSNSTTPSFDTYYSCIYPDCSFTTETEYELSIHMLSHFNNYQFICPYCHSKRLFVSMNALYIHIIRTHFHIQTTSMQTFLKQPVNEFLYKKHNEKQANSKKKSELPANEPLLSSSSSSSAFQNSTNSYPVSSYPSYVIPLHSSNVGPVPYGTYPLLSSPAPSMSSSLSTISNSVSQTQPSQSQSSSSSQQAMTTSSTSTHHGSSTTSTVRHKYACSYPNCSFTCDNKSILQRHIPIHTGERNWFCRYPGCKYASIQKFNLIRHYRVHEKALIHACQYNGCYMTFSDLYAFYDHVLTHKQVNPYQCPYSDCTFETRDHDEMIEHMSQH